MKNERIVLIALAALLSLAPIQVIALGAVSRACQHSTIPPTFNLTMLSPQIVITRAMTKAELPAFASYYGPLFQQNPEFESRYWSLESFTTDYFLDTFQTVELPGRYYLWATAHTWALSDVDGNGNLYPGGQLRWAFYNQWDSSWTSDPKTTDLPVPDSMGQLGPWVKTFLFRARAGTHQPGYTDRFFVDVSRYFGYGFFPVLPRGFKIKGYHFYHNPRTLETASIIPTTATNCNFTHWGFAMERPFI